MATKKSPGRKNRRTTRSTKAIKDLPPRAMRDQEKGEVRGGKITFQPFTITKNIDTSTA